ncbi:hypothetical protein [Kitasatospora sp. NPDC094015]|uniref:hypothetical protein n=1 Tax=Kitasatospora sp. NPDC094015 TaxID=3155205 RepID=UPI00331EF1C5
MTTAAHSAPLPAPAVPPRQEVPYFTPIRRGGGGRHRLRQAVRHRPGLLLAGVLTAVALTSGVLRGGEPPPQAGPGISGVVGEARCTTGH